ncbi:MAG: hypothetical protein WDZ61_00535 [Parcubacteria group bacterium]
MSTFVEKGSLWIHDDKEPRAPHALLTGGLHSNGFFNSRLIIPDQLLMHQTASDLADLLEESPTGKDALLQVTSFVGPQTGATRLSEVLAGEIQHRYGRPCSHASPRKEGEGTERRMVFDDPNALSSGDKVILCEDVVTTGGSAELTARAVCETGAEILPYLLCLVNRSNLVVLMGKKIVPLIHRQMPRWVLEECPYCLKGSKAIPAKDPENWARLTAVA